MMEPTRETFGNIPRSSQLIFYVMIAVAVAICAHGIWCRYRLWRMGMPDNLRALFAGNLRQMLEKNRAALRRFWAEGMGQSRVRGRGLPSWAHGWLVAGFLVLFAGTTLLEINHLATMISQSLEFHKGWYYLIYEVTLDLFGLLFLAGCLLFGIRRWNRPPSLGHNASDWLVLGNFVALGVTGYLVEALRLTWQAPPVEWARWSPVGWMISQSLGLDAAAARPIHFRVWWLHAVLVGVFIASIPYTRLLHFVTAPLNLFFARPVLGVLRPVSMEDVEKYERMGVGEISHFTKQQLLSLDSCMECGRCEEACPAFATDKPLSPKAVVQDLRALMTETGSARGGSTTVRALHGATIQAETLTSCTACSACTGICPVRVDPLALILDMRRNLVGEGLLSGTGATALRKMQSSANPWGLPPDERANWAEGLGAPVCRDKPEFEILYWVGCAGSYDRRAQRVARAMVKVLKHAGVRFAILGREEKCTGESARRMGDEFLFQELAQANIATLDKYNVRKIVAHCPHCLNSLLKDYSQFGGQYEVVHHTQLIEQLAREGRLKFPEESGTSVGSITYHDPCYLARVNGIHEAPREVLRRATGGGCCGLSEMPRNREKTSCCGAGGGRMWMEEDPKQRVSTVRAKEALATGAKTVAVGCPFCLTMMTDGVAANGESAQVLDVAEIVAEKLRL